MLRDLLDALRCPNPHEETWLVAMVFEARGPRLLTADLACPVCGATFTIAEGIARFGEPLASPQDTSCDPFRVAAQLGVTEGPLPIMLSGHYTRAADSVARIIPVPQVCVNGFGGVPSNVADESRISHMRVADRVPLGVGTLAAAAIDAADATPTMLSSVMRAVQQGGRIVAPMSTPVPDGLKELARDQDVWVAEVTTRASGLIELRRRAPDAVQ